MRMRATQLLVWALLVVTVLWTSTAAAQAQTQAAAESVPQLQEVVVTGSRIAAPNEVSTSPIQVLTSESIAVSGRNDISDLIVRLPQNFVNDLGQDLGNGTSGLSGPAGVATADLRGLGPNRTLVLVDGRRLGIGSPNTQIASPAPDLDQIPVGLIDRVDVVTGGASAAYGSDAIAGVINFIMKKDFQGFQIGGQWGANWHSNHDTGVQDLATQFGVTPATGTHLDGYQHTFDVLMGTNFAEGKGNITAYLSYRHADPVASSQRDFGSCQLNPVFDANGDITGKACGGSTNANWFEPITGPNSHTVYSVLGSNFVLNPAAPGNPALNATLTPPAVYNSQPFIYMTREDDRYNAAVLAHEEINDYFQPYAELYFMDDRTHTAIAASALFKDSNPLDPAGAGDYYINCSNPLLSAQQQGILCTPAQIAADTANPGSALAMVRIGRRNVEGGDRFSDYEHENYRAVLGSKGEIGSSWSYDLYGQYYYTTLAISNNKYLSYTNIDNALLVTGTAANPVCISGANQGCVPYNIFTDGAVTQAALNYLYTLGTSHGTSQLRTIHGDLTGKLADYGLTSPLATEGLAVNVGFEHRNDHETYQPDAALESGLLSGAGGAQVPLDAGVAVDEGFLELRAPLVQDRTAVKELLFDTGYRHSDYTTVGSTNTYKLELQYAPTVDYRFRGSYDRAIRAPSVVELFNPPDVGLILFGLDPCAPPISFTLLQCERTGVTAAQYNSGSIPQGTAAQLSQETSGNASLKPETADTYTFGLNFTPAWMPHFSGSIDYYHIKVQDTVGVIPPSVILANCANTGDPAYCSQIVRSPSTGGLNGNAVATGGFFVQKLYNLGTSVVSGIDLQLRYHAPLPGALGAFALEMNGAYLQHTTTAPLPGAHAYDCAGYFGFTCGTVNPRWHHLLVATWETPVDVSVSATWRFLGPVSNDNNSPDPTLRFAGEGGNDYVNPHIPGYSYLDLSARWQVGKILTLRAGINNLLDKDPPELQSFLVAGGAANTYSYYDMFGRQLFAAFTARF